MDEWHDQLESVLRHDFRPWSAICVFTLIRYQGRSRLEGPLLSTVTSRKRGNALISTMPWFFLAKEHFSRTLKWRLCCYTYLVYLAQRSHTNKALLRSFRGIIGAGLSSFSFFIFFRPATNLTKTFTALISFSDCPEPNYVDDFFFFVVLLACWLVCFLLLLLCHSAWCCRWQPCNIMDSPARLHVVFSLQFPVIIPP